MLPELTKLKITAVHCEHLLTHLVTGDGREEALVRPGYKLLVMILNISILFYTRLRSSQILPRVHTRTKRYCSFIQYGLNHYQ